MKIHNLKLPLLLFFILGWVDTSLSRTVSGVEVIYKHKSADDIANNIELESRFNQLNTPLKKIYKQGLQYLKSNQIEDEYINEQVQQILLDNKDEAGVTLALEQLLYKSANKIIDLITVEYGEEKLLEHYPEEFLQNIKKPPIFLNRQKLNTLIKYADENLAKRKQLSLKESYKDSTPIIVDEDLSSLDLSQISLVDIPIWNGKFERSQIMQNAICICSDINLTAADISGSTVHRCKACDIRNDILKTKTESSQKLSCKGIKAERTKFALDQIDLSGSDFSYSDLRNSSWIGDVRLVDSNFHSSDFSGALLEKFSCNECNFTSVTLNAIKILGFLNLIKADIEDRAVINLMAYDNIYLSIGDYEKIPNYVKGNDKRYDVILNGIKYKYDLSGINLANKYLKIIANKNIIFDEADFTNSRIEDSNILNSSMRNVNFTSVKFLDTNIIADLQGAIFTNATKDTKSKIANR